MKVLGRGPKIKQRKGFMTQSYAEQKKTSSWDTVGMAKESIRHHPTNESFRSGTANEHTKIKQRKGLMTQSYAELKKTSSWDMLGPAKDKHQTSTDRWKF